jgi:hypothetical protein
MHVCWTLPVRRCMGDRLLGVGCWAASEPTARRAAACAASRGNGLGLGGLWEGWAGERLAAQLGLLYALCILL